MSGTALNTFMLVFETDGDKATVKKLEKIDAAAEKLAKTNNETAKSAKTAAGEFKQMTRALAGAIAPAMVLGSVLSKTLNFAMQGEQLLFMAKSANMAADEFQKLAIASQRFGGSREGAVGMMAGLASQIQALRLGQSAPLQDAAMFYGLNLQGRDGGLATGNELLRNVAATMERLDTAAQLDLGRRIGLDEATIRILQQGVAAFDEELARAEKRSIFTADDLKRAQEFEITMRDLQLSLQGLWAEIARWLLPAVQNLTEYATQAFDYLTDHSDAVKAALTGITVVMSALAVASLVAAGPWALWVAGITAVIGLIALLYEDWKVFCEGGASALTPLWKGVHWLGETLKGLMGIIEGVIKGVSKALSLLNPLNASKFFNSFKGGISQIKNADMNPLASLQNGFISNTSNFDSSKISNMYNLTVNGVQNPVQGGADLLNTARNEDFLILTTNQEA